MACAVKSRQQSSWHSLRLRAPQILTPLAPENTTIRYGAQMLRITVKTTRKALTFVLEGKLAAAWVRELQDCWNTTVSRQRRPTLRVDLTGVTFVDDAGKACLAALCREGAEFIARDCVTKDVVREICETFSRAEDSVRTA